MTRGPLEEDLISYIEGQLGGRAGWLWERLGPREIYCRPKRCRALAIRGPTKGSEGCVWVKARLTACHFRVSLLGPALALINFTSFNMRDQKWIDDGLTGFKHHCNRSLLFLLILSSLTIPAMIGNKNTHAYQPPSPHPQTQSMTASKKKKDKKHPHCVSPTCASQGVSIPQLFYLLSLT